MTPSSSNSPIDKGERRKRKREYVAMGLVLLSFIALGLLEIRLTRTSSSLPFVNSIFFFGLLNINILLLVALFWLIFRNISKVYLERRNRVIGSHLKSKLVTAFLAFAIIPTLILFAISSMYINSSFDKWFNLKIQNTLQSSLEITRAYYKDAERTSMHFAEHLAKVVSPRLSESKNDPNSLFNHAPRWMLEFLNSQRTLLALDAVEFYSEPFDERVLSNGEDQTTHDLHYPRLSLDLLESAFAGERVSVMHHLGSGDLIRSITPVVRNGHTYGVIVVNSYIPVSLVTRVDEISTVFDDYKDTSPLVAHIKTQYFVILIMITLVVISVAIWIGLYLAKQLTVPVERLVGGVREVGSGNLDVTIEGSGSDEIALLVESFNAMTNDLRENRARLTQTSRDLETRRIQLEAILANIGAGVIVVDSDQNLSTFNRAATLLLSMDESAALGANYESVFTGELKPIQDVILRALTQKPTENNRSAEVVQWNLHRDQSSKALAAIATPLREKATATGVVVVVDDITHLIKSQREMAWREVARRIAHEIKNPLTPIKLSAQRLQRRLGHLAGRDGALIQECTDIIVKHTDELKELVNEFSSFARLPEATPVPNDLNQTLEEVVLLFSQAHPRITFHTSTEAKLPVFEFDRDQIKRVFLNLLDNAVAALETVRSPSIRCETHYNDVLGIAAIVVQDNGPGMTDEVRASLFEPYFSTKHDGTGLGLAIAKRIIDDHHGFIRVESTIGKGSRFLIELPTVARNQEGVLQDITHGS